MKKLTFFHLTPALLMCMVLLMSCGPTQDLKHIEPDAEVSMGLAAPIGDISITIEDILGIAEIEDFLYVDNESVLTYIDTFKINRQFHKIDISSYIANSNATLNVGSNMPAAAQALGYIDGDGTTSIDLNFPFTISFDGVNDELSTERLDRIILKNARFTSSFVVNNMNLDWDEITSAQIVLGDAFTRSAGKTITLPTSGSGFNRRIPIDIDEFTIDLIKNKSVAPSNSNVTNQVDITIHLQITPKNGKRLTFDSSSSINYNLMVELMDYYAIFGQFAASNQMRDENTIVLANEWEGWNDLISLNLPLAEPQIQMNIKHYLGIPLVMYGSHLYAQQNQTGERKYATFGPSANDTTLQIPLKYTSETDPYDAYTTTPFLFNQDQDRGQIDKMFSIRPDVLSYKFDIVPNYAILPSARITQNTEIEVEAIITVPFIFNPGVDLAYSDTAKDISIDEISLDSLLKDVDFVKEMEAANVRLALTTENYIPFDIDADIVFLDANNKVVDIQFNEGNKLHIAGPSRIMGMDAVDATKSLNTVALDKENLERLSKVKAISYKVALGKNTAKVRLKTTNRLKVNVGLMLDAKASLDMQKLFDMITGKDNN